MAQLESLGKRTPWRPLGLVSALTRLDLILIVISLICAAIAYFSHPDIWDFLAVVAAAIAFGTVLVKAILETERQ